MNIDLHVDSDTHSDMVLHPYIDPASHTSSAVHRTQSFTRVELHTHRTTLGHNPTQTQVQQDTGTPTAKDNQSGTQPKRTSHTTRHSQTPNIVTYNPTQETALCTDGAYAQTQSPTQTQEIATLSVTILGPLRQRVAVDRPSTARCSSIQTAPFTALRGPQRTNMQPPGDRVHRDAEPPTQAQVHVPGRLQTPRALGTCGKGSTHITSPICKKTSDLATPKTHLPSREH